MGRKVSKLPVGITDRNGNIQIAFSLNGREFRQSLSIPTNKDNINYASRKRDEILRDIEKKEFSWITHFPKSKLAKAEFASQTPTGELFIKEHLIEFYERHEEPRLAASTNKANKKALLQLITEFGDAPVMSLKPSRIAEYVQHRAKKVKMKTVRNILSPLSNMYKEIEKDYQHRNPVKQVDLGTYYSKKINDERQANNKDENGQIINPYTGAQVSKIIDSAEGQVKNLIQFMFYTGVRTGEAIAIRWDHVNLEQGTAEISRSISVEVESSTKTGESRTLKLLPKAIEALENQAKYTEDLGDFVFHDPDKGGRWQDDQAIRKKAWHPTIKASGVGYRKPYQTRHTYATLLLMGGEDARFVANQLSHKNLDMLNRNYGCILPDKNNPQNYKLRKNWNSFEEEENNE